MSPRMARIVARLERHKHIFDLDANGLGDDLLDIAVVGIISGMMTETAPDGTRWPELSPEYARRKAKISPGNPMGYLFGKMSDPEQIAGARTVSDREARMEYGTDEAARLEATVFSLGNPDNNQPARPFYGFFDSAVENARDHLARHFRRSL